MALAVANDLAEGFEDGRWWVELASLSDPALAPRAMASALDVREAPGRSLTEVLVEHLGPKSTLLVLDNCEHLVELLDEQLGTSPVPETSALHERLRSGEEI